MALLLTAAQASRLWAMDRAASQQILDDLTSDGFLARTRAGAYRRVGTA